ncbi:MAG: hypothetical protein NTZ64_12095 [Polaromonas sp.]|nr:hypothetical protein [Polaromonas sp.]
MNATDLAELAATEFATSVINEIAKKKKMNGMTVAPFIPGVTHDHPPCDFLVETCAYCMRNGNVFAENSPCKDTGDIICKYRTRILEIFEEMEKEITENLDNLMDHTNGDDDDDLERMLMEGLM